MKNLEYKIFECIDAGDNKKLAQLIEADPEAKQIARDYTFLLQGFEGLKQEAFIDDLEVIIQKSSEIDEEIQKGFEHMQVNELTNKLKAYESTLEKTPAKEPMVFRLRTVLAYAASIVLIAASGLWLFVNNTEDLGAEYAMNGPSLMLRSSSQSNDAILLKMIEDKQWSKILDLYAELNSTPEMPYMFYVAFAQLKKGKHEAAAQIFEQIESMNIVEWSEIAQYNRALCLYALEKESYESILNEILDNENHASHKQALWFIKEIK